jgi:quinol monooxygenase YgiN
MKAEGQAALFEKCFTPLAKHVTENETGCFSYKLSWSDSDPDSFIIFERYVSKEYLEDVHCKSSPRPS